MPSKPCTQARAADLLPESRPHKTATLYFVEKNGKKNYSDVFIHQYTNAKILAYNHLTNYCAEIFLF